MPEGRILKGIGGFYYVKSGDNGIIECKARGKFRNQKIVPLVGDIVEISIDDHDKSKGSIEKIFKRTTELIRPAVANVDQAVVVISVVSPEPNLALLDSLLIAAAHRRLDVIICLNKIDLDKEKKYLGVLDIYKGAGYQVVCTSCITRQGIDEFMLLLEGKTSVLAGVSGAGKSSLLNTINDSFELKTGELSFKIQRGKHTTRHAELLEIKQGSYVLDTPGFSSMDLDNIDKGDLQYLFIEFEELILHCKYTGCQHISEIGCRIIEAVDEGSISKLRYQSYLNFYNKLKNVKKW